MFGLCLCISLPLCNAGMEEPKKENIYVGDSCFGFFSFRNLYIIYFYVTSLFIMPKGYEFSQEVKQLMFHIINFVESEKSGLVIPLYNMIDCLVKMLERSIYRLKHGLKNLSQEKTIITTTDRRERRSRDKSIRKFFHPVNFVNEQQKFFYDNRSMENRKKTERSKL